MYLNFYKRCAHSEVSRRYSEEVAIKANPGFFMVFDIEKVCGENGLMQWLEKNGYHLIPIRLRLFASIAI